MKLIHAVNEKRNMASSDPQPGVRALLVVEPGSPPFEAAEFLQRLLPGGSRVRILNVRPYQLHSDGPWSGLGSRAPGSPDPGDHQITLRILEGSGATISTKQRFGSPPDEILEEASDWGADLIVVGHHNGLGRWFLGSVADNLLKRSIVPVVVVPQLGAVREAVRSARRASVVSALGAEPGLV